MTHRVAPGRSAPATPPAAGSPAGPASAPPTGPVAGPVADEAVALAVAARWIEAAALLAAGGRLPAALLGWLGPSWSGPSARAYADWARSFERAGRHAGDALADAGESLRRHGHRWPDARGPAELDAVRAGARAVDEVPIPGSRSARLTGRAGHHPRHPHHHDRRHPHDHDHRYPDRHGHRTSQHPGPRDHRDPGSGSRDRAGHPAAPADHSGDGGGPPSRPETAAHRSGRLADWIAEAVAVLREHGYRPEDMDPAAIAAVVAHESSGNPEAVNRWDANAARGTPSMGLMQTIAPTFHRWHLPGHDRILDPVDNIIAGVRYAVDRYGSMSRVPGLRNLAAGQAYRGY